MYSKASAAILVVLSSSAIQMAHGFQQPAFVVSASRRSPAAFATLLKVTKEDAEAKADEYEEPKLTESGLPELKGDFDWDAKFAGDDDWITEDVPGKIVVDEVTLAQQVTALDQLETKWRKERLRGEYESDKKIGFVEQAELMNSRFAMFFLVTGLLTELWTGVSIPGQVEELLRVGGVIGFDG